MAFYDQIFWFCGLNRRANNQKQITLCASGFQSSIFIRSYGRLYAFLMCKHTNFEICHFYSVREKLNKDIRSIQTKYIREKLYKEIRSIPTKYIVYLTLKAGYIKLPLVRSYLQPFSGLKLTFLFTNVPCTYPDEFFFVTELKSCTLLLFILYIFYIKTELENRPLIVRVRLRRMCPSIFQWANPTCSDRHFKIF